MDLILEFLQVQIHLGLDLAHFAEFVTIHSCFVKLSTKLLKIIAFVSKFLHSDL